MQDTPTIWFLRHGQTEWKRTSRLQGQLNSPLTDQGIAEAHQQARILVPILARKPALWTSPLGRARQTADIALDGATYRTDPRLMEIDAGKWQGLYRDDIMAAHPDWARRNPTALEIYEKAEGGEGIEAFHTRIVSFLSELSRPSVIVAHGLWGQILRAHLCGVPLTEAGQLSNLQGVVYRLQNGVEEVLEAQG